MILARRSVEAQKAYLEATISAYEYIMNSSDCGEALSRKLFHMAELQKAQLEEIKRTEAKTKS